MTLEKKFHQLDTVLAYRLLQLRLMILDRRLTVKSVSRALGVSSTYMSRVLGAKVNPSLDWLDKVDEAIHQLSHPIEDEHE